MQEERHVAGESADLRFLAARLRRPHGKAGNADDAVGLAQRVERFGRLLGEADDTARPGHFSFHLDVNTAGFTDTNFGDNRINSTANAQRAHQARSTSRCRPPGSSPWTPRTVGGSQL